MGGGGGHQKNMSDKEYQKFLQSEKWQDFRKMVYKIFGYRCWFCKKNNVRLNVHHTRYYKTTTQKLGRRLIHNSLRWFLVVCDSCHKEIHRIEKEEALEIYKATKEFKKRNYPYAKMRMPRKYAKRIVDILNA